MAIRLDGACSSSGPAGARGWSAEQQTAGASRRVGGGGGAPAERSGERDQARVAHAIAVDGDVRERGQRARRERARERGGARVADLVVVVQPELRQHAVDAERVGDGGGARVADLVGVQHELRQRAVDVERVGDGV